MITIVSNNIIAIKIPYKLFIITDEVTFVRIFEISVCRMLFDALRNRVTYLSTLVFKQSLCSIGETVSQL